MEPGFKSFSLGQKALGKIGQLSQISNYCYRKRGIQFRDIAQTRTIPQRLRLLQDFASAF